MSLAEMIVDNESFEKVNSHMDMAKKRSMMSYHSSDETLNAIRRGSSPSPPPISRTQKRTSLDQQPVGFWDPDLSTTRTRVFLEYLKTLFILCVFVLAVLSIYWGVLASIYQKLPNATIAVVDFDGESPYQETEPIVGPYILAAVNAQLELPRHLGFQVRPPSDFDNDPMNVRVAVVDEKYWAAIVINSNATALLRRAVETGNSSYDPLGIAQIMYNEARDIEAYNQYVTPVLKQLGTDIMSSFGSNWTSTVLGNSSLTASTYARAPQALSPAISFSIFNLRPFEPPTSIPAVSIGLIYLIIIAFFSFSFFMPIHAKFITPNPQAPHRPLHFRQLILWRYGSALFTYFCLSLSYSLVSLAFQIPFSHTPPPDASGHVPAHWPKTEVAVNADYFGHATFVVYWMINFLGMSALGLACENMAMLLGPPWTALWLIFWVITNVSTGFYSLELASNFYRWGYVWPLRNIVVASRTLLFGVKDELGYNVGILIAWIVAGTILFPFCCKVLRNRTIKEKQKAMAMQRP